MKNGEKKLNDFREWQNERLKREGQSFDDMLKQTVKELSIKKTNIEKNIKFKEDSKLK